MVAQAVSAVATVREPPATWMVWMVSVPLAVARAAAGIGEEREGLEATAGAMAGTVATVGNVPRRSWPRPHWHLRRCWHWHLRKRLGRSARGT